jgi:hypothetical protein
VTTTRCHETDTGTSTVLSGSGAGVHGVHGVSGRGGTTASELDDTTLGDGPIPGGEASGAADTDNRGAERAI